MLFKTIKAVPPSLGELSKLREVEWAIEGMFLWQVTVLKRFTKHIHGTMLYHVQTVKNQVRFDYYSVVISFEESKQEYTIK